MRKSALLLVFCATFIAQAKLIAQTSADAIRAACADDAKKFCANVQPGGGRIVACLKEHKDSLSEGCRKAAGLPPSAASTPAPSPAGATGTSTPPASSVQPSGAGIPAAKPSPTGAAASGKASTPPSGTGSYLRLKQVQIIAHVDDRSLGGKADMPALDMLIPSGWNFTGGVSTNPKEGCYSDFFAPSWEATGSDGITAFQGAPNDSWQYADDPAALKRLNDPTRRARGAGGKPCPVKKPMKAEEYFRQEIMPVFPAGSSVVSIDPWPELNQIARKQLGLPPDTGGKGVGAGGANGGSTRTEAVRGRVKFQRDGKDGEAWVTVVVVTRVYPQGRGAFYDCHAIDITAFRAPQGQLDGNEKLYKVMISSIHPEEKWQSYSGGFIAKLYQIEAQKEAQMDAAVAAFQKYEADTINGVTANAFRGSMNSVNAFDQNIRGVQTFRDPATGRTMELSNLYDHAWLNNSNEYVMCDDPNFNPNGVFSGDWNQLQPVRPAP
jgi:hypothetical protein